MKDEEIRITLPLEGETKIMFEEIFSRSVFKSKTEFLRSLIAKEHQAMGLSK